MLLCVLWVRSYWCSDGFKGSLGNWYVDGFAELGQVSLGAYPSGYSAGWSIDSAPLPTSKVSRFGMEFGSFGVVAVSPLWLAASVGFATAALPWIRWRFSLRTLLIATTLVAIALGLAVWAAR